IETGAGMLDKGLMDYADEAGIEAKLLDTATVPFGHNAAETIRAIPVMKNKWGMPVGCSFHNTVESWHWLKNYKKAHSGIYRLCDVCSNGLVVIFGASFSLYGPIESAKLVFPYVAMVDKIVSEGAEDYFGVLPAEGHPRLRLE
ncbi:MAG: tetrahydromethanopterin S-methyltransferase subunit H, partial [Thermoplasmata archaeon]|nr:tetrahydromethanopterin S-methyltransferase subunit H [Thermoplasmata archaeon]